MSIDSIIKEHHTEVVKTKDLIFDDKNPNQMSALESQSLEYSLEKWGNVRHVVVDQNNVIADGEHRVRVYLNKKIEMIPVIRYHFKNDAERKLFRQTMNKLHGTHDPKLDANDILSILESDKKNGKKELMRLLAQENDNDILKMLEKNKVEFDKSIFSSNGETDEDLNNLPDPETISDPIVKKGDIWQLGDHKLLCGDCTNPFKNQFTKFDLVVTSPPYDNLRNYNNEFDLDKLIDNFLLNDKFFTIVWIVGDQSIDNDETGTSFKQALKFKEKGFKLHDTMIYHKKFLPNPSNNRYHQQFEYMFVFVKGELKTFNPIIDKENKQAGQIHYISKRDGVNDTISTTKFVTINDMSMRGNVWSYDSINNFDKLAVSHPAIFPLKLVKDHIISWSNEKDIVLDPFCGSGSTLIACEQTNRKCYGVEIEPKYCDIIIKRWENLTGKKAKKL